MQQQIQPVYVKLVGGTQIVIEELVPEKRLKVELVMGMENVARIKICQTTATAPVIKDGTVLPVKFRPVLVIVTTVANVYSANAYVKKAGKALAATKWIVKICALAMEPAK